MIANLSGVPFRATRAARSIVVDVLCFVTAAGIVAGASCQGGHSCGANTAAAHPVTVAPAVAGGH